MSEFNDGNLGLNGGVDEFDWKGDSSIELFPSFQDSYYVNSLHNNATSSSNVCTLTGTGMECRTCGSYDGRTSTSTLGVLVCMAIMVAWTVVKRRRAGSRLPGQVDHVSEIEEKAEH